VFSFQAADQYETFALLPGAEIVILVLTVPLGWKTVKMRGGPNRKLLLTDIPVVVILVFLKNLGGEHHAPVEFPNQPCALSDRDTLPVNTVVPDFRIGEGKAASGGHFSGNRNRDFDHLPDEQSLHHQQQLTQ
jgi:hypothetical protein